MKCYIGFCTPTRTKMDINIKEKRSPGSNPNGIKRRQSATRAETRTLTWTQVWAKIRRTRTKIGTETGRVYAHRRCGKGGRAHATEVLSRHSKEVCGHTSFLTLRVSCPCRRQITRQFLMDLRSTMACGCARDSMRYCAKLHDTWWSLKNSK